MSDIEKHYGNREDYKRAKAAIKKDGIYDLGFGAEVIINSPPDEMTIRIAKALEDAAEIREKSYDHKAADKKEKSGDRYVDFTKFYRKNLGQAAFEACLENKLEPNMWYPIYMMLETCWNDIIDWAKEMQAKDA